MVYDYIDDETGTIVQRALPITADIPKKIIVDGVEYRRDYGAGRKAAIIVPYKWGSTENPIRFNRGPSGKKHFW